MTRHTGSCHCGRVRFAVDTEHPLGPYFRCNCSLCSRKGAVMGAAPAAGFTLLTGADDLGTYRWNTHEAQHHLCTHCGIYTHHRMRGEPQTLGLNMACIDGFDIAALGDVPMGDGRSAWSLTLQAAALGGRQGPIERVG